MNRCGSTCGYRWVWRRWRPAASHGSGGPAPSRSRTVWLWPAILVAVSIPIMIYIYAVVWTRPKEWTEAYHLARYRWLGRELIVAMLADRNSGDIGLLGRARGRGCC